MIKRSSGHLQGQCVDCGKVLSKTSYKRCHPCNNGKEYAGERHPQWKGDGVSYKGLHSWVRKHLVKPGLCQDCGRVAPYDLANISQQYKRDLSDWEWLCRRCHMEKDGRLEATRLGTHVVQMVHDSLGRFVSKL